MFIQKELKPGGSKRFNKKSLKTTLEIGILRGYGSTVILLILLIIADFA